MPYHNKFRLLHFTLQQNLEEVYANIFLKTFALSLIGVFVPVYFLHELGLAFHEVLLYYLSLSLFLMVGYLFGAFFCNRIGLKKLVLLSIPFHLLHYFLLYHLEFSPIPLWVIGAFYGIAEGMFWLSYNVNFAHFSDRKHRGEEVNLRYILAAGIGIVGPFLGGFLLTYMSFYIVFVLVILLLLFSVFPLFHITEEQRHVHFSFNDVFYEKNLTYTPRFFVEGMRGVVSGVFWPIFIFVIVKDYFSLGMVSSVASLFSSVVVWVIANRVDTFDRDRKKRFTDTFSLIHGLVSFVKATLSEVFHVYIVGVLSLITYGVTEVSLEAISFNKANKNRKVVGFFVFRDIVLNVARIFTLGLLFFSGLDMVASLKLGFILLGATSVLQKFLAPSYKNVAKNSSL